MSLDEGSLLRRAKVLEPDASPQQQLRAEARSPEERVAGLRSGKLDALFSDENPPVEPQAAPDLEPTDAAGPSTPAPPTPLPVVLSASEHEQLAQANAARHDWIAQAGRPQGEVHGVYQRTADFRISTTDPDAKTSSGYSRSAAGVAHRSQVGWQQRPNVHLSSTVCSWWWELDL
jgi:hypothetical protein